MFTIAFVKQENPLGKFLLKWEISLILRNFAVVVNYVF